MVSTADREPQNAAQFNLDDMALLHHWTRVASLSIVDSPGHANKLWQDLITSIGLEHAFVMHAILSLAALHLACSQPSSKEQWLTISTRHHNKALQGMQDSINQLNAQNGHAVFACSFLNIINIFCVHGRLADGSTGELRTSLRKSQILGADLIPMIRGVQAVLAPVHQHILQGPLAPLMEIGHWMSLTPDISAPPADEHFRKLRDVWAADSDTEVYDHTLYELRKCCAYVKESEVSPGGTPNSSYNGRWAAPEIWLLMTQPEYFVRLEQRQPAALLLYCYMGALMHDLECHWFLKGWGRNIVDVVAEILGPYWSKWTVWPKQVVGLP